MNESVFPTRIPFSKFSASANDFIVLDNREGLYNHLASELSKRACARRYSVGADGLILVETSPRASFRVRFFNPDGNEFNTCGNGGRCAARFAVLSGICDSAMSIETNIGIIDAEVQNQSVKLKFIGPSDVRFDQTLRMNDNEVTGHRVFLGEPHFVVERIVSPAESIVPLARKIRYHPDLGTEGANVHFIQILSRQNVRIRTYERGVEDETLACGSGCVSAAVATFLRRQTDPPITFQPQSGIPVKVHFHPDRHFQDLYLEGDARLIYKGELSGEALTGFPIQR
jgi:diaminopimelate epimerase